MVVHVNQETGQVCLPQSLCRWILDSRNQKRILEGFDTTAGRIATTQLGFEVSVTGYNRITSLQPDAVRTNGESFVYPPFLLDTSVSAGGVAKITAWFLGIMIENKEPRESTVLSRGEEWKAELVSEKEAKERLSPHEVPILEKAIVAGVKFRHELLDKSVQDLFEKPPQ